MENQTINHPTGGQLLKDKSSQTEVAFTFNHVIFIALPTWVMWHTFSFLENLDKTEVPIIVKHLMVAPGLRKLDNLFWIIVYTCYSNNSISTKYSLTTKEWCKC